MNNTHQYQLILVQPQGRLDGQGGRALEKQLVSLITDSQTLLIVNLEQVEFMNSSGLVSLARALKNARISGCRLVLCNLQPPIKLIFELTQLDSVFEIFDTCAAAKATVEKAALVA